MERLSKVMSRAGISSRRAAEKLIQEGLVLVNGEKVLLPQTRVDPTKDHISVSGKPLPSQPPSVVYLLNKPRGFVCSNVRSSPKQRLVFDLLPSSEKRLFTVGRLDKDTEGLLLITNNGFLKQEIIHPKQNIEKEYIIKTKEPLGSSELVALGKPLYILGKKVQAKRVKKIRKNTCSIIVTEGKKHEVRLMVEKARLTLLSLKRIRIGNLRLGALPKGLFKVLREKELEALFSSHPKKDVIRSASH